MIIFDLDDVLCDTKHRRHFIDPTLDDKYEYTSMVSPVFYNEFIYGTERMFTCPNRVNKDIGEHSQPDFAAYDNACDGDYPVFAVLELVETLLTHDEYEQLPLSEIYIWTSRCESVREKTAKWLDKHLNNRQRIQELKMRPVGNTEPVHVLKEWWLDERISDMGNQAISDIDFVFDADPESIAMWRRRGIFCFDCRQE